MVRLLSGLASPFSIYRSILNGRNWLSSFPHYKRLNKLWRGHDYSLLPVEKVWVYPIPNFMLITRTVEVTTSKDVPGFVSNALLMPFINEVSVYQQCVSESDHFSGHLVSRKGLHLPFITSMLQDSHEHGTGHCDPRRYRYHPQARNESPDGAAPAC